MYPFAARFTAEAANGVLPDEIGIRVNVRGAGLAATLPPANRLQAAHIPITSSEKKLPEPALRLNEWLINENAISLSLHMSYERYHQSYCGFHNPDTDWRQYSLVE